MPLAAERRAGGARSKLRRFREQGGGPLILARELGYRTSRGVRRGLLRCGYGRLVASERGPAGLRPLPIELDPSIFAAPELAGVEDRLRATAAAAAEHRFDLLGSGPTELGAEIDWQRDFKSGYRWPSLPYSRIEVTRLGDASDAKVPWELSRCHHFLALARAARVLGEPGYGEELARAWASWLAANPVGIGINWANPMEVAIRAVNWAWALSTIGPEALPAPLRERIATSLRCHGRHIRWNLEGSPRLHSNHYLADILGLLVIASVLEGGDAERWFRFAQRAFEREIIGQVGGDGLGFEASVGYHGLSLEMFLIARWVAVARGRPFSSRYDDRLAAMVEASRGIRSAAGLVPRFGDFDDGRILPLTEARPCSHDHLLWAAAIVTGCAPPPDPGGAGDAVLSFGRRGWADAVKRERRSTGDCVELADGGIWVLRGQRSELALRCGGVGQNGNGGHAHNDLCSYELSIDGVVLIADPGTYVYTADPAARNAFRSTRAHATVEVAGREINPIEPERLFGLRPFARPFRRRFEVDAERALLRVGHDGYRRLPGRVVHERTVALERGRDRYAISDELTGSGSVEATLRVPLAAGVEVTEEDGSLLLRRDGISARVSFGDQRPSLARGWVSDGYGRRRRAPVLELAISGDLPLQRSHRIEVLG